MRLHTLPVINEWLPQYKLVVVLPRCAAAEKYNSTLLIDLSLRLPSQSALYFPYSTPGQHIPNTYVYIYTYVHLLVLVPISPSFHMCHVSPMYFMCWSLYRSLCNGLYELLRVMWSGKWVRLHVFTVLSMH